MAKRIVRRGSAQLRAELALVEACEPIEDAHAEAKDLYREALASGDPVAIRAAKAVKVAAANALNETRTWLRREAAIVKLSTITIPKLEAVLAGPVLVKHGDADAREDPKARAQVQEALAAARAELEVMAAKAVQVRRDLEALGGVVQGDPVPHDLPPGSADVDLPTISVKPRVDGASGSKGGK